MKAHTWQVTNAYSYMPRAKSVAGSALKRCRRGSALQEMQACKPAYKVASRNFTKMKDAEDWLGRCFASRWGMRLLRGRLS